MRECCGIGVTWNNTNIANFDNFVVGNNLFDLHLTGRVYTWYRQDGSCKSRLDRMLVNGEWISRWPNVVLKGGRRTLSDHCSIFVEAEAKDWGPKPFRFFNYWISHPSFKPLVNSKWSSFSIRGWGSYILKEKLKLLKGVLKEWRVETFGELDKSIEDKKCEIERLDRIDDVFGLDEVETKEREDVMADLVKESSWREAQLYKKSRIKWITEGDINNTFFHNWINMRNKRNEIHGIRVNGEWVDSVQGVKSEIFNHFQKRFQAVNTCRPFFGQHQFPNALDSAINSFLTAEFTEEEIKSVIWSIDSNGSPGPDGFTFGFYKNNWDTIKGDIMKMMQDFHANGKPVKGFNPSFICLVPKKNDPKRIEDFRPISLIGSAYKIIAKTLAVRLSKVVDSLVAENQTAFIKGRQIMDGILILNEAIDEAKRKKMWRLFFKVDFEKAFDSID